MRLYRSIKFKLWIFQRFLHFLHSRRSEAAICGQVFRLSVLLEASNFCLKLNVGISIKLTSTEKLIYRAGKFNISPVLIMFSRIISKHGQLIEW